MGVPDPLIGVRVLGPLSVTAADGSAIAMTARKHAELLAILTVERSACSPDRIADLLWRHHPPPSAGGTLQGYVSRLRKQLAPTASVRIDTVPAGYVLRCDGAGTDLDQLDRLGQEGLQLIRTDPAAGAEILCSALDLWRGDPLTEIADIDHYAPELARLDEMRSELTEAAAEALRIVGEPRRAVAMLNSLCHRHPYREGAVRSLARALRDDGRVADALDVIRRLRRTLSEDLGLDPGTETTALEGELLDPAATAPPAPIPAPVGRSLRLVGRSAERAALDRVWTAGVSRPAGALLVGPSGIGKTALAEDLVARRSAVARRFVGRPGGGGPPFAGVEELFGDVPGPNAAAICQAVTAMLWTDVAAHGRAVVLLDDLQWLDIDSARVLARVLSGMPHTPVTVLATCRTPDEESVDIVRGALDRHGTLVAITVRELSDREIGELIGQRLTDLGVDSAVDETELARRCLGNPVIATQLCDAVAWGSDPRLGEPAHGVIGDRLDELPDAAREFMTFLAVAGGRLPAEVAAELGGPAHQRVVETVRQTGLVRTADDGAFVVAHDSVREAILGRSSRRQRVAAHRALAVVFGVVRPHDLEAVAVHRAESADDADRAQAATSCLAAGRAALASDAANTALDLARRGIALHPDDELAVALHRIAGTAATRIGEFDVAAESFDVAATISRHRREWPALAETALLAAPRGVAGYWSGFGVVESVDPALVRESLAHSAELDPESVARLHAGEAARLTLLGLPGAEDHLGAARLAAGNPTAVDYEVALAEFLVRWEPGRLSDRSKIAGALVEMTDGDPDRRATALHLQRVCALEAGDLRLTRRLSTEFVRLIGRRADADLTTMQLWWQVMLALLRGDYPASRALTEQFADSVGGLSQRARLLAEASIATSRSIEAWHHGDLVSMLPAFDELIDQVDDDFTLVIALGSAEAGEHDRALELIAELTADADRWTGSRIVARVPLLTEALYAISRSPDHLTSARDLCARLGRFVAEWSTGLIVQWPGLVCMGPAVLYRGTVKAILGETGALDDLDAAISLARDTGARPYQERARRRRDELARVAR